MSSDRSSAIGTGTGSVAAIASRVHQYAIASPSGGAAHRENQVLGQQLADQAPSARAERLPHGELAVAPRGACQHEIGDVDTDDQQDERDDREEYAVNTVAAPRHLRVEHRRAIDGGRGLRARAALLPRGAVARWCRDRLARARDRRQVSDGPQDESCPRAGQVDPGRSTASDASGTHNDPASGASTPVNPSGATPTIVNGWPLSAIVRPTASVDPPNRRIQNACDRTATGGAPGRRRPMGRAGVRGRRRCRWCEK